MKKNKGMSYYVAVENDKILGIGGFGKDNHVHTLFVDVRYHGKGVGTQLVSRFCREVDACSSPAYLETDTDKNVRFYERFGFAVVKETEIFGVKNRYMWKPPVS